jgi:hypothetical protein
MKLCRDIPPLSGVPVFRGRKQRINVGRILGRRDLH